METKLVKLKSDFNDIINIRNTVKNVFDILQVRIDRLHQMYGEFIKTNKSEMFVFGLDSFHFQSKLIDIEYDDMRRLFLAINNRMYCEYFKLHKIIVDYISKNVFDKKVSDLVRINNFPIYKDLEPFKEYKFETILDIHENILNLLGMLMSILFNKENELSIHKTKQNLGLNIDNFITSFNFNINVMREKIMMFITYIEFFHKMHSKYLKRFSNKIQLMYTHISNDIKFDDSVEISKNKKKELIEEFITGNVDQNLLKELKTSIGSETNSEISCDGSKSSVNSPINQAPNISNSLESLTFTSTVDINNQNTSSNEIISSNGIITPQVSIVKEKKDYKNIFQRNVHKVSSLLQLWKPKQNKIVDPKTSDKEIEEMFNGIEESCDSIINEKPQDNLTLESDKIALHIDSVDSEDNKSISFISISNDKSKDIQNGEKYIVINEEHTIINEQPITIMNEDHDIVVNKEPDTIVNEEPDTVINEEPDTIVNEESVTVINEEPVTVINEEPVTVVNEEPVTVVNEEPVTVVNEEPVTVVKEEEIVINEEEPVKKKRTYTKKKK